MRDRRTDGWKPIYLPTTSLCVGYNKTVSGFLANSGEKWRPFSPGFNESQEQCCSIFPSFACQYPSEAGVLYQRTDESAQRTFKNVLLYQRLTVRPVLDLMAKKVTSLKNKHKQSRQSSGHHIWCMTCNWRRRSPVWKTNKNKVDKVHGHHVWCITCNKYGKMQ